METKAAEATSKRIYEVFEPYCKWKTDETQDTLDLDLKGFQKEQLKVQASNRGVLVIYGERPVDASKWCRFRKETKISKGCNPSEIRAKFSQGNLCIVMPKRVKEAEKENVKEEGAVEGNEEARDAGPQKGSVWGVEINKRRVLKVAVMIMVVVVVVALGTQISRLVHKHSNDIDAGKEGDL